MVEITQDLPENIWQLLQVENKKIKQVSKFFVEISLIPNPPPLTHLEIFLRSASTTCLSVFTALSVL